MLLVWAADVEDLCPAVCSAAFPWRDRRRHSIPHFLLLPRPSFWAALHSLTVPLLWLCLSPGCVHRLDLSFICWPRDWPKSPGLQNQNWESVGGAQLLAFDQVSGGFWSLLRVWELQGGYPHTPQLQHCRIPDSLSGKFPSCLWGQVLPFKKLRDKWHIRCEWT